jgi:hypothetical protein
MSAFPGPANPILYAQFHLRGAWKNTLAVTAGYALLIGGAMFLTANAAGTRSAAIAFRGWLNVLIGLQVFVLLIYGSFRVSSAVRHDITSKILESHRLMPTSAFSATIGYLFGGPIQAIALAVVNFVLGLTASEQIALDLQCWIIANVMLGATVLLAWIIVEQIAFTTRGGFVLLILGTISAVLSNGIAMVLIPGFSVLTCPLVGRSVFNLSATFKDISFPFAVALCAQFLIGAIFFRAAMRKYRDPNTVAFSTMLGLLLTMVWVIVGLIGLFDLKEFVPPWFFNRGEIIPSEVQLVATILMTMLIGILPVCSAARAISEWRRHGGPTPAQPRQPMPLIAGVVLTAILVCLLLAFGFVESTQLNRRSLITACVGSAVIVLAFLAGIGLLFRWIYTLTGKGWLVAMIWLILTWIVPMMADLIYHAMMTDPPDSLTMVSALSPIGALGLIWKPPETPVNVMPGIVFQCAMVLLPAMLLFTATRRKTPALVPSPGTQGEG